MLGFEFDNNSEPYSVFNMAQSTGAFIFMIIESAVDTNSRYLVYSSFIGIIGILSCSMTFFFEFRDLKSQAPEVRKSIAIIMHTHSQMQNTARMSQSFQRKIEIELEDFTNQKQ